MGILALIGLILLLVALSGFANIYKERGILNNFIIGIIAAIVGVVVAGVLAVVSLFTTVLNFLYKIFPGWDGNFASLSGLTPDVSKINWTDVLPLLGELIAVFLVLCIFLIIAAFFIRRSLNALSTKTGVGLLSTGALVLFIGAILTVILIGFVIMWISALIIAIAFFEIKAQPEQPATPVAPPSPPSTIT
jgi:uncharacterized membrane protein